MPLTDQERADIRYHCGYLGTTDPASMVLGVPTPGQTSFLLENAMTRLSVDQEPRVRELLGECERVEREMKSSRSQLKAAKIGSMELRGLKPGESVVDALEREHTRWAQRLAELLGAPLGPHAQRFKGGAGRIGTVPIVRRW